MTEVPARLNGMYYLSDGRIYPSVTTVLKVIAKPALTNWLAKNAVREALADPTLTVDGAIAKVYQNTSHAINRGDLVHELLAQKREWEVSISGYKKAYDNWGVEFGKFEIVSQEESIWHDEYQYAGTLDMVVSREEDGNEERWLIDFKTGSRIYNETQLQLSAYQSAYNFLHDERVDKIGCLRLASDGSYEFVEFKPDLETFLAVLRLWRWNMGGTEK